MHISLTLSLQNRILDSVGEGEGGMFQENSIETCILSRVKQITSPGWMHETSARTWCKALGPGALGRPRGSGWRGRWEGGSGWGTHVSPWLFHFNVWQNPLQIKKKIIIKDTLEQEKKNVLYWVFTTCKLWCETLYTSFCLCLFITTFYPYIIDHGNFANFYYKRPSLSESILLLSLLFLDFKTECVVKNTCT